MKSGVLPSSKAGLSAPPLWPGTWCSGLQAPGRAVRVRHPCCDSGGLADRNLRWLGPRQGLMCGNFLLDPVPLRSLLFSPSVLVGLFYPSEKGPSISFRLFLSCPSSPATGSDPEEKGVPLSVVWEGWSPSSCSGHNQSPGSQGCRGWRVWARGDPPPCTMAVPRQVCSLHSGAVCPGDRRVGSTGGTGLHDLSEARRADTFHLHRPVASKILLCRLGFCL